MSIKLFLAVGLVALLGACGSKDESQEKKNPGMGRITAANGESKNSGYDKAMAIKEESGEIEQLTLTVWSSAENSNDSLVFRKRGSIKLNETYEITPDSKIPADNKGTYLSAKRKLKNVDSDVTGSVTYIQVDKVVTCKLDLTLADGKKLMLTVDAQVYKAWRP